MTVSNKAIELLPSEKVVMTSDNETLTLTNFRVRYNAQEFGSSSLVSMTLGAVASCGLITKSFPILLILAGFTLLAGFVIDDGNKEKLYIAIGVALALTFIYFITRRAVISITSSGSQAIVVPAKGMKRPDIVKFIDAVEREKLAREA
jgi:hypothetical protein